MTFHTSQGFKVETVEFKGRATPFQHGEYVVLAVAVNGRAYPPWQIPAPQWQQEIKTLSEAEFWQNVADAALSMGDVNAALRY